MTKKQGPKNSKRGAETKGSHRETIESVVIAFILAFLFRTFEAEAFVIPTGSMAPTLMGRHKDVTCQECGYEFTVGASDEDPNAETGYDEPEQCVCPNCRFYNDIEDAVSFKGDRILVVKSLSGLPTLIPTSVREPQRWDVMVFKFPEEPHINYIKRLVGLPNEQIMIHAGNIYTRKSDSEPFQIARKPPEKQLVLGMLVYDNNHVPASLKQQPSLARWVSDDGTATTKDSRVFQLDPTGDGWSLLSYRHWNQPWRRDNGRLEKKDVGHHWSAIGSDEEPEELVTDFYGYNTGKYQLPEETWVADLAVACRVSSESADCRVRLELVEAGALFICELDFGQGHCTLLKRDVDGVQDERMAVARNVLPGPGTYDVRFSNFDDRLTVWIDGSPISFADSSATDHPFLDYQGPDLENKQAFLPTVEDLRPVRIGCKGGKATLGDIALYRDIFYTLADRRDDYQIGSPQYWAGIKSAATYELGPDDFLMLGDNSPRSKDGRAWDHGSNLWLDKLARERSKGYEEIREEVGRRFGGDIITAERYVVRRQLIIGKAFFIYWPHGVPVPGVNFEVPLGNNLVRKFGRFRFPFYPNVARMKRIQ